MFQDSNSPVFSEKNVVLNIDIHVHVTIINNYNTLIFFFIADAYGYSGEHYNTFILFSIVLMQPYN